MIHAELNSILNCAKNGICTQKSTAYITTEPCNNCLQYLWQAGVVKVIYSDFDPPKMVDNEEHRRIREGLLVLMHGRLELTFIPSSIIQKSSV
jgi:deoxycytidylate deaminase